MKKSKMRTALLVAVAPFVLGACQSQQKQSKEEVKSLQVMTYNVRSGLGMDEVRDINRVIQAIQRQNPDLVAVQELDSVTTRCQGTYPLGLIAEQTGMVATYAPTIDFQGGKYGVGMLSKEKPMDVKQYRLPGREEQRTLLMVEFKDFVYGCTHLSLTPDDRLLSLPIINKVAAECKKPVIIAGDFNARPDDAFILGLQQTFKVVSPMDVMTYPADVPTETIDYMAVRKQDTARVKAVAVEVVNEPVASDHRPIVATIEVR